MLWQLKGCKRCGGDIFIIKNEEGWNVECLQCGYSSSKPLISRARRKQEEMLFRVQQGKPELVSAGRE